MRNFRLRISLCVLLSIASASVAVICLMLGRIAWGIVCVLVCLSAACWLVGLIRRLIGLMSSFAYALEMDDTTFRMQADETDSELRRLGESMNRIMDSHHSDRLALETSKLYYDRILSVMTHEMRNSIAPVIALSDDMMRHPDKYDSQSRQEAVGVIYAQSDGIKRFLDSYHTLTHLPAPALLTVDAAGFFSEIKTAVDSRCAHDGLPSGLITYVVPVGIKLEIDPGLMRQAICNLIGNAIDAVSSSESPAIKVIVSQTDGMPYISVEDNGPGISPEIMPNLFQPFMTDKPSGTGIGLCLSRQIAMLHGGDLRLASTGGHGTSFIITLPA